MGGISIATNASLCDLYRLRLILPHWMRTFDQRVSEIVVVVDEQPPQGRISRLHRRTFRREEIYEELDRLGRSDSRLRCVPLSFAAIEATSRKWFLRGRPVRCQDGSPIYAFIRSIEEVRGSTVLRADCDMLFFDRGWLDRASELLAAGVADLVSPPRLGGRTDSISSRAFLLRPRVFAERCLPLSPCKVDWIRRSYRFLQGRPRWMALENQFLKAEELGRLRHRVLETSLGFSMHVPSTGDVEEEGFARVVEDVEAGRIPRAQEEAGWDYVRKAWASDDCGATVRE